MQIDLVINTRRLVNLIAFPIQYIIYDKIKGKNLINKLSLKNLSELLSKIGKINIYQEWHIDKVPKKTMIMLHKLGYTYIWFI